MDRLWDNRRTAAKLSNVLRNIRSKPWNSLLTVLLALGIYMLGSLHGEARGNLSTNSHKAYSCPDVEPCPPCDIPEGLKALIPPLSSQYEDTLRSTAFKWLSPWQKYDFEEAPIHTKMIDDLWDHMVENQFASFRVRVINGTLQWPPTLLQHSVQNNIYYMPRVDHWHNLFLTLEEAYELPDYLDMVISTQDHPKILKTQENVNKAPLFVYTTTTAYTDIPLPNTEYYGRIDTWLPEEMQRARSWDGRIAKAIWRGSPTGGVYTKENFWQYARTRLVNHTRANSDILDAKFLPCAPGQCSDETFAAMKAAGLPSDTKHFSFGEYTNHKYLVDIDGNAWSSRYPYVLASGAIFFKAESPFTEYFYDFLTPYKDYIPIASDASDLPEKLRYAVAHDEEMRLMHARLLDKYSKIVGNANWLKYVHFLLSEYSSLLERPKELALLDRLEQKSEDGVVRFTGNV